MIEKISLIFLFRGLSASGSILITLAIPLVLGLDESAVFLKGFAVLYFVSIFSRMGIDIFILKDSSSDFTKAKKNINSKDRLCLLTPFLISIGILLLYLIVNDLIFDEKFDSYLWVFLSLPPFSCLGVISNLFKSKGKDLLGAISEVGIVSFIATKLLLIFLFILELDFGVEFCFILSSWFSFFLSLVVVLLSFDKLEKDESIFDFFNILISSWFYFLNQASSYLSQWFPVFLFSGVGGANFIVYYSVANRLATVISFVGVTIDSYAAPRYSRLWASGDMDSVWSLKKRLDRFSLFVSLFFMFLMISLGFLYGYLKSYDLFYFVFVFVLIFSYSLSVGMGPNGFLLMMTDSNKFVTFVTSLICLFIVLLSLFFYFIGFEYFLVFLVGFGVFARNFIFKVKVEGKKV